MVVNGMREGHFPVRQVGGLQVITSPAEIDIAHAGELRTALLAAAQLLAAAERGGPGRGRDRPPTGALDLCGAQPWDTPRPSSASPRIAADPARD
jgi:hypothetical protein